MPGERVSSVEGKRQRPVASFSSVQARRWQRQTSTSLSEGGTEEGVALRASCQHQRAVNGSADNSTLHTAGQTVDAISIVLPRVPRLRSPRRRTSQHLQRYDERQLAHLFRWPSYTRHPQQKKRLRRTQTL